MRKIKSLMYSSMILATILGVYGQSISYYISRNIVEMSPVYYLTILTSISLLLFLATPILAYKFNKNNKQINFAITVNINSFIGILISAWSLFVLAMWWS